MGASFLIIHFWRGHYQLLYIMFINLECEVPLLGVQDKPGFNLTMKLK